MVSVEMETDTEDLPLDTQPDIPWKDIAREDPLLPPKLLLRFLAKLQSTIFPPCLYPGIRKSTSLEFVSQFHLALSF
jgi:hypothetical protein